MAKDKKGEESEKEAFSGDFTETMAQLPAQLEIRAPRGCLPPERAGVKHGWHSQDAVQIPTSLLCNLCPLYYLKKKDKRHPLSCPEGQKNQVCPILTRQQQCWAFGLIREVEEAGSGPPTPSDLCRIEQIVRHRSRIFQVENFLKVVGLLDLKKGEIRNVADRLTTTENALTRTIGEFRQALAERRANRTSPGPRLEDYLKKVRAVGNGNGSDGSDREG